MTTPSTLDVTAAAESLGYEPSKSDALGSRTVRGSLWTVGSYAGVNVIRLASNLILTRLLLPNMFGVMVIVNTVMTGIRLFSDVGIGPALISNPRGEDERFLRTAFTTQLVRGFAIWLVAVALALPVAHLYARTDPTLLVLAKLLPVAGFVAVIEGLRSTAIFRLQRQLRFAEQSMLDVVEIAVTAVGMVVWAKFNASVWALVVPPLFGSAAAMAASHCILRDRRDRLGWDKVSAHDLMRVGRWIFVSTVLTFLAGQFDKLVFGKLIDATMLGVYGIAITLALMPTTAVLKIGGSVLFPTFSRVADDPVRFANVYGRARTMLLAVAALIVSGMIAVGPFAIEAMYKPAYDDARWMIQLLAIGVWFQIVDATNVAALLARERPNWMAAGNLTKVIGMCALVPVGYHAYGVAGAIVALGVADGLRAITSTIGMRKLGVPRSILVPDVVFPLAIVAVGLIALEMARLLVPHVEPVVPAGKFHRFVVATLVGGAASALVVGAWGPICAWQWKRSRRRAGV